MTTEQTERLNKIRAKGDGKNFYDCNFLIRIIEQQQDEMNQVANRLLKIEDSLTVESRLEQEST